MKRPLATLIRYFGQPAVVVCDGQCEKAFGLVTRPKIQLDEDNEDDYAFLADHEVGEAPDDPQTYEGGQGKPSDRCHNKWCVRQCERSSLCPPDGWNKTLEAPDFSERVYNIPRK